MRSFLNRLRQELGFNTKSSASVAKERLQIIVAHERSHRPHGRRNIDLQELQLKLIDVIADYLHVQKEDVAVQLVEKGQDRSVLELNVTLPDGV